MDRAFSREVLRTAHDLIGQYGDDAEVIAVMRAAELAALGDAEGLSVWDEIIACIESIQVADGAPKTAPLH